MWQGDFFPLNGSSKCFDMPYVVGGPMGLAFYHLLSYNGMLSTFVSLMISHGFHGNRGLIIYTSPVCAHYFSGVTSPFSSVILAVALVG